MNDEAHTPQLQEWLLGSPKALRIGNSLNAMEKYKEKENNELGQFRVYMLHKKGGEWYCKNAREKMPGWTEQIVPSAYFGKLLNMKEYTVFKDYNKWAFVIEKKYLKPSIIKEESDFNPSDQTGEIAKNTIRYEVPDGEKYEVILYEQKVGSNKWIELERRKFTIGDKIDNRDWREEFTKKIRRKSIMYLEYD